MQNVCAKTARLCKQRRKFLPPQMSYLVAVGIIQAREFSSRRATTYSSNYYDALALTPKATQAQIKTAYYNLSKLYHPDVNKTKEASAKFAELSEAYETLGNVQKRRLYDRGFVNPSGTRGDYHEHYPSPFRDAQGFGERRRTPPRGRTKVYDFDEFYRRHYGESIHQNEKVKEHNLRQEREKESTKGDTARSVFAIGLIIGIVLAIWPFASTKRQTKDDTFR